MEKIAHKPKVGRLVKLLLFVNKLKQKTEVE